MEKGPQYITSIQKRVHNTLVQYGKRSTIYKFNTVKGPQYISSIWIAVYNTSIQYGIRSTIHKFNMEKGPQYITSIQKRVHNVGQPTFESKENEREEEIERREN